MQPKDASEQFDEVTVLDELPLRRTNERRRELRCVTDLPLRLTSGFGETIPAVLRNLSARGLLATADERFSLLLPPPNGARFEGEFFLDDVEVRRLLLEVVRVEKQNVHIINLGCQFVDPPPFLTAALRARIMARAAAERGPRV
jgi:hypothetical protein